jgi:[acyl-carrier-protein] S-malonyltransferase
MIQTQLGIIFPGQGSQSVGMLINLAEKHPIISTTFSEASRYLGYDLANIIAQGPEEKLNSTEITQPALLAASVALWRLMSEKTALNPAYLAGHSLGEYSALVCAEAMAFGDALKLVQARGHYMQEAVPAGFGSMAAIIGLDNEKIAALCEQAAEGDIVAPANFNAIGQTVVAGETAAVERLIDLAKSAGAKLAKKISVSVPSHCELMKSAKTKLISALSAVKINSPKFKILHNVDLESHSHPDDIRHALAEQLDHPVRWVETIQALSENGIATLWECGPGKVLAGLVKRIDKNIEVIDLSDENQIITLLEKTDISVV